MDRLFAIRLWGLLLSFIVFFLVCGKAPPKKEAWAMVIDFFSPDTGYYPITKKFPFPDSLQFLPFETYFTNKDKAPIITDSTIVFYDNYQTGGQKSCCKLDTLELYTDTINGKKYLFAVGDYISVFLSDTNSTTKLRPRQIPSSHSLWGVQLNVPYSPENFQVQHEKLGAKYVKIDERIDEVSRQAWNDNDSILTETIQFKNSNERLITQVYKDLNEAQTDSIIHHFRKQLPRLTYKEAIQRDEAGTMLKHVRMLFQGVVVSITQTSEDEYSLTMTDYYETIKLLIRNAGTGYIFRDDVSIH